MDFRQLRTILNVAQLGSISLAANRLNIAQSALSRQIQALEGELGVRLLHRHGRGVSLTAEGSLMEARAALILREVEATRQAFDTDPNVLTGEVAFGMPPSVADALAGPVIETFRAAHPQVKLRAVTGASGYVLDWLQRGLIDVGVIYDIKPSPMIETIPLLEDTLYFVERGDQGEHGEITLHDAMRRPLVLPSVSHGLRQLLDGVAAAEGLAFETVTEAESLHVLVDLAQRGLAATILPRISIDREIEMRTLSARRIVSPSITRRMILARVIDRQASPATRAFVDMMQTVSARIFS